MFFNIPSNRLAIKPYVTFVLSNVPSLRELFYNNIMKSVLETFNDKYLDAFGGNPTTTSIFRDVVMLPGVAYNAWVGQQIGQKMLGENIKLTYDFYSMVGTLSRLGCKAAIFRYSNVTEEEFPALARSANAYCEYGSLFLNIASRERQREERTDEFWLSYLFEKAQLSWVYETFLGASIRYYISDRAGEVLNILKVTNNTKAASEYVENGVLNNVIRIDANFTDNEKIWSKMDKIHQSEQSSSFAMYAADTLVVTSAIVTRYGIEVIATYVVMPVTRFGASLVECALKETLPKASDFIIAHPASVILPVVLAAAYMVVDTVNITSYNYDDVFSYSYFKQSAEPQLCGELGDGLAECI